MPKKKQEHCQKCGRLGATTTTGKPTRHKHTVKRRDDNGEIRELSRWCRGSSWPTVEERDRQNKAAGWEYVESRDG